MSNSNVFVKKWKIYLKSSKKADTILDSAPFSISSAYANLWRVRATMKPTEIWPTLTMCLKLESSERVKINASVNFYIINPITGKKKTAWCRFNFQQGGELFYREWSLSAIKKKNAHQGFVEGGCEVILHKS